MKFRMLAMTILALGLSVSLATAGGNCSESEKASSAKGTSCCASTSKKASMTKAEGVTAGKQAVVTNASMESSCHEDGKKASMTKNASCCSTSKKASMTSTSSTKTVETASTEK